MNRLFAAAFAAMLLAEQQTPPPVFRAGTDLVEIDVVVRARAGRCVQALQVAAFDLREDGQPQPVDVLSLVTVEHASPRANVFVAMFDDAHLSRENFRHAQSAASELFSKRF